MNSEKIEFGKDIHIGKYTKIEGPSIIGHHVWIGSWVHIRPLCLIEDNVHIRNWCIIEGENKIGYNTRIMQYCNITAGGIIGNECFIGPGVILLNDRVMRYPEPFKEGEREPVVIGNKVKVGGNATIMPAVTLGEGCVIGAGSVVTKDTEPYTIYVGNPARPIRKV